MYLIYIRNVIKLLEDLAFNLVQYNHFGCLPTRTALPSGKHILTPFVPPDCIASVMSTSISDKNEALPQFPMDEMVIQDEDVPIAVHIPLLVDVSIMLRATIERLIATFDEYKR